MPPRAILIVAALLAGSAAVVAAGSGATARPAREAAPPPAASRPARPVILDPGHGGPDLGAVRRGRLEKDIALAVGRRLKARLEKEGVPVRMTREGDDYLPLDRRISQSIAWDGAVFVSLHLNDDRDKSAEGIEVYAFGRQKRRFPFIRRKHRLPPLPAPPRAAREASADFASSLVRSLRAQGLKVGRAEKASFYVLKNPTVPSVLVELGYLSNAAEAQRLADTGYQDRLALALAGGLRQYLASLDTDGAALAQLSRR